MQILLSAPSHSGIPICHLLCTARYLFLARSPRADCESLKYLKMYPNMLAWKNVHRWQSSGYDSWIGYKQVIRPDCKPINEMENSTWSYRINIWWRRSHGDEPVSHPGPLIQGSITNGWQTTWFNQEIGIHRKARCVRGNPLVPKRMGWNASARSTLLQKLQSVLELKTENNSRL